MKKIKYLLCLLLLTGCTKSENYQNNIVYEYVNGELVEFHFEPAEEKEETFEEKMDKLTNALFEKFKCNGEKLRPNEDDVIDLKKPVVYLYPEETTKVNVKLDLEGKLLFTYPKYEKEWNVIAESDGTLTDKETGKEYSYLFWEGDSDVDWDFSEGYVVKGEDTVEFLQSTLSKMGLIPKEYNEFIVYWAPLMEGNEYNLISFQEEIYEETAELIITPKPDSILRVFMAYKALENPIEIKAPTIKPFERNGFTVVEWGGTEVK